MNFLHEGKGFFFYLFDKKILVFPDIFKMLGASRNKANYTKFNQTDFVKRIKEQTESLSN